MHGRYLPMPRTIGVIPRTAALPAQYTPWGSKYINNTYLLWGLKYMNIAHFLAVWSPRDWSLPTFEYRASTCTLERFLYQCVHFVTGPVCKDMMGAVTKEEAVRHVSIRNKQGT